MGAFLKIENPGVADPTAFTLLGASTSRDSGNANTIGKFGSGNKHGVAVLLRNQLAPVVFAGNLRMTFGTVPVIVDNGIHSTEFARVQVKYGGKDRQGTNRSGTEDLGFVLEYGASDWSTVDLALREFVSNSIDRAIAEGEADFNRNWQTENGITDENRGDADVRVRYKAAIDEYRKIAHDFDKVTVEVVNEGQVRAAQGGANTRVFVPLSEDVLRFYNNLGKWFLHFSEPELLGTAILPKKARNIDPDRKTAVIYRRGVRVREWETDDKASLFDYNLDALELDEARKVDDWRVRQAAARAFRDANTEQVGILYQSFMDNVPYWEHAFDHYGLDGSYDTDKVKAARSVVWSSAFSAVVGEDAVIATAEGGTNAKRKGYSVLNAPEAFVKAAGQFGVRTPEKVLTQDDREGREIIDATPDALTALDFVWDVVQRHAMTNGKARPAVKVYRKIMSGGGQSLGFYRDGVIFLNADIAGYATVGAGFNGLSQQLIVTALEEVSHHVTGATDNSRDFQDYVLNLAVKLAKVQAGIL